MHKELRPLYFYRTIYFKPLASWFSQLIRFPRTLPRSLLRKFQAMTIHIHRELSPPVLVCRYLHTRFVNCHGNLILQMSKTKATNFLRLIAFGLVIYCSSIIEISDLSKPYNEYNISSICFIPTSLSQFPFNIA